MSLARTFATVLAVMLAALVVVGCGGASKGEYEDEVSRLSRAVNDDLDTLDGGMPTTEDVAEAQETLRDAASELDDLDPPAEVERLHEDLVASLRDMADLFERMSPFIDKAADPEQLDDDDRAEMNAIVEEFTKIERRMNRIEDGFRDKDYAVGLDGPASK